MTELGILQIQGSNVPVFPFPFSSSSQSGQPIQTRAALAFLLSEEGNFFREFLLDEVLGVERNASQCEIQKAFHKYYLGISLRPSLV